MTFPYPLHYDMYAARMREMIASGMGAKQIANEIGLSQTTVRRIKALCLADETAGESHKHCRDPWADMKVALAQIKNPKPSPEECVRAAHDLYIQDLRKYHPEREINGRR